MNAFVHCTLTACWAEEEGFSEHVASLLGRETRDFDRLVVFKPWAHFSRCGARFLTRVFFWLSVRKGSVKYLAWSLHAAQDAIGHGQVLPWQHDSVPDIDRWATKSPHERAAIEFETRRLVHEFARSCPWAAGASGTGKVRS